MSTNNKSKLSLSDIFNLHLENVDSSDRSYVRENGFLLIISLSGGEIRSSNVGADSIGVNNGYMTKPLTTETKTFVPFLTSWRGFGLHPDGKLYEYDDLGRQFEGKDDKLAHDYKGIPINWKVNLDDPFLRKVVPSENKENRAWQEFKALICAKEKAQLQLLIVKSADPTKGVGKLLPMSSNKKNPASSARYTYDIALTKSDIYSAKLVFPGTEYLSKVDKPSAIMQRLQGRLVDDGEGGAIPVVNPFIGLTNSRKEIEQRLQKEATAASEESTNSTSSKPESKSTSKKSTNSTHSEDEYKDESEEEDDSNRLGM